jgi:hypothetical protein
LADNAGDSHLVADVVDTEAAAGVAVADSVDLVAKKFKIEKKKCSVVYTYAIFISKCKNPIDLQLLLVKFAENRFCLHNDLD